MTEDIFTSGDFTFTLSGNDAIITGYTGSPQIEKLTVPDALDGHPVISVSDSAFRAAKSIMIRDSDAGIECNAFAAKDSVFAGCAGVEMLVLPEHMREITREFMSNFRRVKSVTIRNPDAMIECDAFVVNADLEYLFLSKKLYSRIINDKFPGISGKVGFNKYGINAFVTQLALIERDSTNVTTANNIMGTYKEGMREYALGLKKMDKLLIALSDRPDRLYDVGGNSDANAYAYKYAKRRLRNAMSPCDVKAITFLKSLANDLGYDSLNEFEQFDEKIDKCLYSMFASILANGRTSTMENWISSEFSRRDAVHKMRNENVLLCCDAAIRALATCIYKLELLWLSSESRADHAAGDRRDFGAIAGLLFSEPEIDKGSMDNLISFINLKNSSGTDITDDTYEYYADLYMDGKIVPSIMLWGLSKSLINADETVNYFVNRYKGSKEDVDDTRKQLLKAALIGGVEDEFALSVKILEDLNAGFLMDDDFTRLADAIAARKAKQPTQPKRPESKGTPASDSVIDPRSADAVKQIPARRG